MSILTWRDVATPDLSGAGALQRNAADAMNNAFTSAQGSLLNFKDARANIADRDIINKMLTYQNPADLQAALADGSLIGPNGQYAHQSVLEGLPKNVGDMLQNSLTQANTSNVQAMTGHTQADTLNVQATTGHTQADTAAEQAKTAQDAILNQRSNAEYAANKALGPVINGLVADPAHQGATGVPLALSKLEQDPTFKIMTPEQQAAARAQLTNGLAAPTTASNALFDSIEAGAKARAQVAADANIRQLDQLPKTEDIYNAVQNTQDPRVRQLLQDHYAAKYPTLFPSQYSDKDLTRGPLGSPGGAELDPEHSLYAPGKYSYSAPAGGYSNTTVGQSLELGKTMREQNKNDVLDAKGNAVGSSAQTQYMMNDATRTTAAQALFNANPEKYKAQGAQSWDQIKLTPQNTDDMAKYNFEHFANTPEKLKGQWDSLNKDDINVIAKSGYDWDVARPIIIGRENGISLDAMVNKQANSLSNQLTAATAASQQAANNPVVANYAKYMAANSDDAMSAAKFAIANTSGLTGANPQTLANNISALIAKSRVHLSYDQAALALANSVHDDQFMSSTIKRDFHNAVNANDNKIMSFEGRHVDLDQAVQRAKEITDPTLVGQANAMMKNQLALQNANVSNTYYQKAFNDYKTARDNYALNPEKYADQYGKSLKNLGLANAFQGQTETDAIRKNPLDIHAPAPTQAPPGMASSIISQILNTPRPF
jgi:hypothetical protein